MGGFIVAQVVWGVVLCMLITVVCLVGHMGYSGELYLKKVDAANLDKKHSSHGGGWGGSRLSSGIRI